MLLQNPECTIQRLETSSISRCVGYDLSVDQHGHDSQTQSDRENVEIPETKLLWGQGVCGGEQFWNPAHSNRRQNSLYAKAMDKTNQTPELSGGRTPLEESEERL